MDDSKNSRDVFYLFPVSSVVAAVGTDTVRAKLDHLKIFVALFICEIAYLLVIVGLASRLSSIAQSIATASGVANVGLIPQYYSFLPIWAPITPWWAKRHL